MHQSPDPQVSATWGAWTAGRCIQSDAGSLKRWRYLTPVAPRVWTSNRVAEWRSMTPGAPSSRLSAYLTTCAMRAASRIRLAGDEAEGSKTTRAPDADASRAKLSAPRERRSRKKTQGSRTASLRSSAILTVMGLKLGSHLPQYGHDHVKRCVGEPSGSRWICCTTIGVWAVGAQSVWSRWTPQWAMSARTRFEAMSEFIRAMG